MSSLIAPTALTEAVPPGRRRMPRTTASSAGRPGAGSTVPRAGRGRHGARLGANVILSTPTGTGKSLVAIAAHAACLAAGGRSYYTAPIKALVSEKFFARRDLRRRQRGHGHGDSSVNPDAPIVCCTAEILANIALRQGADAAVDQVVMDEFHFYGDPERGWAWQVPLLLLTGVQFLLMSATLGDVSTIAADLARRTGRAVAEVTGVERPVPLHSPTSDGPCTRC
jgi:superfamily II RNA helicase